ncbi:hypothetical protein BRUCa_2554 [Brucella melitensis]|nr:hypothetical protein BM28_B0383 [Brucella melitensis M28]ADZ88498.1 hypothetical protein BM590_B0381 [Brucella melitensis M5-90]AEW19488.1 Arylsulfatase A-related enzyme [Brucella abortus A13334]
MFRCHHGTCRPCKSRDTDRQSFCANKTEHAFPPLHWF